MRKVEAALWILLMADLALGLVAASTHHCHETTSLPVDWMHAIDPSAAHYETGKMYPVHVITGKIVPPGDPDPGPDRKITLWMCRWHAAQWLGYDPVTKTKCCRVEFATKHLKDGTP